MFGDGSLTLREFAMKEPLPLARIQEVVLAFLRRREDAVLFGAQAVNAYVDEPRMTQDVDILSTRATELAQELRTHLADTFGIAVRIRDVASGRGFRIFQLRQPKNRHLVDLRQVDELPPTRIVAEIRVPVPEELIAQKVISASRRGAQPKGDTDRRDLKVLLLACPQLKTEAGPVLDRLKANHADQRALGEWKNLVATDIDASDSDEAEDW
ncbi:MAG TPA: nucleotidyl transferase AbiEii/AbiGii toxin family protein [Tepidisphaeraceae bacterium]|nr:nucleotidyl transferase AbiEii/AbiGii toxin family protein [Tepidisphaeraceae bacterium]